MLEKMIRERCEGSEIPIDEQGQPKVLPNTVNTKEVEDLILQLFEIVNEKNELFRRQAELMYLYVDFRKISSSWFIINSLFCSRRLHRLEQEQADIEYEIRVLMAQPERNKTDSDKAREEGLIARKVEVISPVKYDRGIQCCIRLPTVSNIIRSIETIDGLIQALQKFLTYIELTLYSSSSDRLAAQ